MTWLNGGNVTDNNKLSFDDIRAILFDLDGTLRHSRPSFDDALADFAAQSGASGVVEKRKRVLRWVHYYWAQSPELLADYQTFEGNRELVLTNFARKHLIAYGCGAERAADLAPDFYRYIMEEHQSEDRVLPGTLETLQALKEAGFTLGVVSNRPEPVHDLLDTLGIGPYLKFALVAGEVDSYKPEGEIFQHALQLAGSRAECTMYVGDNYYADVVGAQRAGLKPVLLDPEDIFPDAECPVIRSLGELQGEG